MSDVVLDTAYERLLKALGKAFEEEFNSMPPYLTMEERIGGTYSVVLYCVHESDLMDTVDSMVSQEFHKWKEKKMKEVEHDSKSASGN